MTMKNRGFEIVSSYENKNINLPKRTTNHSAGYDIESGSDYVILPEQVCYVETGLKAYMKEDEVLHIYPRSSLAKNKSLVLLNSVGVIDSDYYNNLENEGHILIQLYNFRKEPVVLKKGERIVQGVFSTFLKADNEAPKGVIRLGGFGSTGL